MKKYILLLSVVISFSAYAKNEQSLVGERNGNTSSSMCDAPSIKGCGPCYAQCVANNPQDRTPSKDIHEVSGKGKTKAVKASEQ